MADVAYTAAARADLLRIIDELVQRASIAVAERYERRFTDAFDLFERHPGIGAPRPSLGATTRLWAVPPYVIFYDLSGTNVLVLRVLDERRKLTPEMLR